MLKQLLRRLGRYWGTTDPYLRAIAFVGKLGVEVGGSAVLVAAVLAPIYVGILALPGATPPLDVWGVVGPWGTLTLFVGGKAFCTIIVPPD